MSERKLWMKNRAKDRGMGSLLWRGKSLWRIMRQQLFSGGKDENSLVLVAYSVPVWIELVCLQHSHRIIILKFHTDALMYVLFALYDGLSCNRFAVYSVTRTTPHQWAMCGSDSGIAYRSTYRKDRFYLMWIMKRKKNCDGGAHSDIQMGTKYSILVPVTSIYIFAVVTVLFSPRSAAVHNQFMHINQCNAVYNCFASQWAHRLFSSYANDKLALLAFICLCAYKLRETLCTDTQWRG